MSNLWIHSWQVLQRCKVYLFVFFVSRIQIYALYQVMIVKTSKKIGRGEGPSSACSRACHRCLAAVERACERSHLMPFRRLESMICVWPAL